MLTPELDVLKPIDPSITNSDDYEIYSLSNASVAYGTNGLPASLLVAYADTPLRVEGRLEQLDRSQAKYLVKKPYKPADVVIRNVTRFSYGQMTDGELVIWALGEAGWYEIRPRRDYKPIYQDMVEAVELLYFVSDIYNEPRKRGGGPGAARIFQKYAEDERFSCNDLETAAQMFHKHHEFLLMCFLTKAQGIGWSNTPIYQYFKRQYPEAWEIAKARIEGSYNPTASKPSLTPTAAATQKKNASRGKQESQKSTQPRPPKKDNNWWEAAAIYEFIHSAVNKRALKIGRDHITIDRVAKLMTKRYEIDDVEVAKQVILVHAQNIIYKMEHPRNKSASFFTEEPIYQELHRGHDLPAADIRRAEVVALRPRRDLALYREMSEASSSDDSDELMATPQQRPRRRKKRGRLSVLRPTSGSKFSGKGKRPSGSNNRGKTLGMEVRSSSEAEDEDDSGGDSGDEVFTPTQALVNGEKRKHRDTTNDDDEEDEDEPNRRKRAASSSPTHSSQASPTSSSASPTAEEAGNEAPIPIRYRNPTDPKTGQPLSQSSTIPPIISSPLPTYEANGPRDSWICTFDGCSQRIYGVKKLIGRQLITEHLEDHAKGREGVVGILLREEEKLRLPVDNLLKKIREMSEAKQPLFPAELGEETKALKSQPPPIRRVL